MRQIRQELRIKGSLEEYLIKISEQSLTGKAIRNTLGLWPRLTRYADTGIVAIDNNAPRERDSSLRRGPQELVVRRLAGGRQGNGHALQSDGDRQGQWQGTVRLPEVLIGSPPQRHW